MSQLLNTSAIDTSEIDSVLQRVASIIDDCVRVGDRAGYFAAMYYQVTRAVKTGIERGDFDDGERMSRFDRIFADLYFEAFDAHRAGTAVPAAWAVAFDATARRWPIALQHLLLGMNAHIGVDLGIAVTKVNPGAPLDDLQADFDRINAILASLVDQVQAALNEVSPWLEFLDRVGDQHDEALAGFSVEVARNGAWDFAQQLSRADERDRPRLIAERFETVAQFGRRLERPGFPICLLTAAIRARESSDPARIIRALS